jgi:hypothetical protein
MAVDIVAVDRADWVKNAPSFRENVKPQVLGKLGELLPRRRARSFARSNLSRYHRGSQRLC